MKALTLLLFCALAAFVLPGMNAAGNPDVDEKEYQASMKTLGATMGHLRKSMEAKAVEDVVTDASKIEAVFLLSEKFWTERKTEDAIKWSKDGAAAAKELGVATKANDAEKAGAAAKAIGATCMACHTAHREKLPDGSYKIK